MTSINGSGPSPDKLCIYQIIPLSLDTYYCGNCPLDLSRVSNPFLIGTETSFYGQYKYCSTMFLHSRLLWENPRNAAKHIWTFYSSGDMTVPAGTSWHLPRSIYRMFVHCLHNSFSLLCSATRAWNCTSTAFLLLNRATCEREDKQLVSLGV